MPMGSISATVSYGIFVVQVQPMCSPSPALIFKVGNEFDADLNFTVKIYQKGTHVCFYLFASFTSVPLHFLLFLSLVESNPSRQSSCKCLLINLVAHDFIMKLMVLLIRGAVSFFLIDIILYRKMRNHFLLSFVSSNASYMIIHCFMGSHMSFHAT